MNDRRRGSIKKRLAIGLGSTALVAATMVAYFAFFRNHAPVINSADISSQYAYILEDGSSKGVHISANASDPDKGYEGLDRVIAEITTPSGNDSLNLEKTNGLFSIAYEPKEIGPYTVTITAIDGQGKKSKSKTLEFEAITDHKSKVTGYKVFPDTGLYNGDNIEVSINATDDIDIESAIVNMKNSDGTVTSIPLSKANGSYKATHKIDEPGDYELEARVADSAGQVTIVDMGTLKVLLDNFPEILDYKVPSYVKPGQGFSPWAEVNDDRGIESVILEIEGITDKFVFNNTENNLWKSPEISISKKGSYGYILTATDSGGQKTTEEGTITVRTPSSGGGGGDGGGGDGCFTADTKVLMANGSFKPIVDIKENEEVQSFDFKTNNISKNKVTRLFKFDADSHLLINNNLKVTEKHPFAVGFDTWKEAGKLKIGDNVLGLKDIKLKSIKKVLKATQVFNLTVDGTHNYFVSDGKEVFLVHNKGMAYGCFIKGSEVLMANKKIKNIEKIEIGEEVLGFNTKTKKWEKYPVTERQVVKNKEGYFIINKKLKVSPFHKIYVNGEGKTAPQIKLNDMIINGHKKTKVTSIELIEKKADRYNIVLGRNKDIMFMVNDVLVCNGW